MVGASYLIISTTYLEFPDRPPNQWEPYTLELLVTTPPPSPPPPPPATTTAAPATAQTVAREYTPSVIPDEIPQLEARIEPLVPIRFQTAGLAGGVEGGLMGGVVGGIVSGEIGGKLLGTTGSVPQERQPGEPLVLPRDSPLPLISVRKPYPIYPRDAQMQGQEGTVIVRYLIDVQGRVAKVELVRAARTKAFNASALQAIRQWQFKPMMENGQPVEVVHELTIYFELERG